MSTFEVGLAIFGAVSVITMFFINRYLNLAEKRKDERHAEMVFIQKSQHKEITTLNESFQREIKTIKEDTIRDFRIRDEKIANDFKVRDEKLADDLRIRDKQISDNRHQVKNLTANIMMLMAKQYPEFIDYFEKFMKND